MPWDSAWEFAVLDFIQNNLRTPFLDQWMPLLTRLGSEWCIWIPFTALLLIPKRTRRTGIVMALAMLLEYASCDLLLKPFFMRIRPYDINTAVTLLVPPCTNYSFPSGHTAVSFAAVGALQERDSIFTVPSLILAIAIAFSRMYLYVHYPTDIIGGIVLGLLCGFVSDKIIGIVYRYRRKKKLAAAVETVVDTAVQAAASSAEAQLEADGSAAQTEDTVHNGRNPDAP